MHIFTFNTTFPNTHKHKPDPILYTADNKNIRGQANISVRQHTTHTMEKIKLVQPYQSSSASSLRHQIGRQTYTRTQSRKPRTETWNTHIAHPKPHTKNTHTHIATCADRLRASTSARRLCDSAKPSTRGLRPNACALRPCDCGTHSLYYTYGVGVVCPFSSANRTEQAATATKATTLTRTHTVHEASETADDDEDDEDDDDATRTETCGSGA